MRSSHVKKLDFNKGITYCRGVVATDIALANLEQIEKNELVSKWMLNDSFNTSSTLKQDNSSLPYSTVVIFDQNDQRHSPIHEPKELLSSIYENLEKSPVIKCREKKFADNPSSDLTNKSPIIGRNRKIKVKSGQNVKSRYYDKRKFNRSHSSSNSDKSPILGKARGLNSTHKYHHKIKRKKLYDPSTDSIFIENGIKSSEFILPDRITKIESFEASPELFKVERLTASPILVPKIAIKKEEDKAQNLFCFHGEYEECKVEQLSPKISIDCEKYHPDSSIPPALQKKKSFSEFKRFEESFILKTEESCSTERRHFVTDTERIDCDTSSETEDVKDEIISAGAESDSDKTVSDLIEEPITQEFVEALESDPNPCNKLKTISSLSKDTILTNSLKITATTSSREINSPNVSIVDISVETTPPCAEGDDYAALVANLDSDKKKKSRPKKGSLSARLQKLISGQVSCVRLWRYQMCREPTTEKTSSSYTTLLVVRRWNEYGKDLYESKVLDDPYNLLSDYLAKNKESRNPIVMTNPTFVGFIQLPVSTVFRIYLPWEIYKSNSATANSVLHVLYFNVVSDSLHIKSEQDCKDYKDVKNENLRIIQEYDCPCLKNGRIDDLCSSKFTDCKIDVIEEIIK